MSSSKSAEDVAVVIGGGGGIGLGVAARLAGRYELLIADVSQANVDSALDSLRAIGGRASGAVCDVTDQDSVRRLAKTVRDLGRLRVLVNTAGLSPALADARTIMDVNLLGTATILEEFLPLAGAGTAVVCLASCSAYRPGFGSFDDLVRDPLTPANTAALHEAFPHDGDSGAAYAVSKRGVILLCESRAHDWGTKGARVVSVSPGPTDTSMGRAEENPDNPRARQFMAAATPSRRGRVHEVAAVIDFLCSDDASYVNGCDLRVDAGAMATLLAGPVLG